MHVKIQLWMLFPIVSHDKQAEQRTRCIFNNSFVTASFLRGIKQLKTPHQLQHWSRSQNKLSYSITAESYVTQEWSTPFSLWLKWNTHFSQACVSYSYVMFMSYNTKSTVVLFKIKNSPMWRFACSRNICRFTHLTAKYNQTTIDSFKFRQGSTNPF